MSDQNLPDQNKSNQNMNAQPETASDQIAPNATTIDNLVVTKSVRIGVPNTETSEPQNRLYVVAPGGFPNNVPIVAQSVSTFFGAKDSAGNERFAINLDSDGTSYPVNFYDKYDGRWRRSISLKLGNVGIGTTNPEAKLHISDPSFRGNMKLFATSGVGHDFGYDGGIDNFFAFAHYGLESGQTKFVWHQNEAATRDLLTIKNTGNIGIGTDNPLSMLHIGDGLPTPPSGGYRPWMVRGTQVSWDSDNVFFGLKDEGENRKDAVIAWGDDPKFDVFRFIFTANGGPADGQEIMRLQPNGNVGIGTTNPTGKLEIEDGSFPDSKIRFGGPQGGAHHLSSKRDMVFDSDNPFGTERGCFYFRKTAFDNLASYRNLVVITEAGDLKATGNVYANGILLTSSRELKENIAELSGKEAVEALKNLNPVKFNFKADSDKNRHIGFIAEDVPELVATSDRKTLSPMDIVAVLTQALKEQQNTISALAEKVKLLEAKTA